MIDEETDDEFWEDFGRDPLTDRELDSLLRRARESGDVELRRAIKALKGLRWLSGVLLDRVEQAEPNAADPIIKTARFVVRGEGAIGKGGA
jgi:hypothetical protein